MSCFFDNSQSGNANDPLPEEADECMKIKRGLPHRLKKKQDLIFCEKEVLARSRPSKSYRSDSDSVDFISRVIFYFTYSSEENFVAKYISMALIFFF